MRGFTGFGVVQNENLGRLSCDPWTELFNLHKSNPKDWDDDKLAKKYMVDVGLLGRVLKYNNIPTVVQSKSGYIAHWEVKYIQR